LQNGSCLAPVLALLFLMVAMGHAPAVFSYANLHAFAAHWLGKLSILGVITLFLWHAAHRLRVTLHDFGLRQDAVVAVAVYLVAAAGTALTVLYLFRI
jgi:fumarate reductase subunit D